MIVLNQSYSKDAASEVYYRKVDMQFKSNKRKAVQPKPQTVNRLIQLKAPTNLSLLCQEQSKQHSGMPYSELTNILQSPLPFIQGKLFLH